MKNRQILFFENDKEDIDTGFISQLTYHSHLHKYLEFGYIFSGSTELKISKTSYSLTSGKAYLITPYQIHSFKDNDNEKLNAALIIFNDSLIPSFKTILNHRRLANPVFNIDYDKISFHVEKINEYKTANSRFKEQILGGHLSIILSEILENQDLISENNYSKENISQNILIYCNEHFKENISLEKIAADLNISKSYVSQVFNNTLKISFSECINQLRINEAISLIDSGEPSLSKIAFESGFNSIRSFNRNFYDFTGSTPGDYMKNK